MGTPTKYEVGLRRAGLIPVRAADCVVLGGALLVGLTTAAATIGVTGAFDVPVLGEASEAGATAAYLLTAPFMTTLLPFAVGAALLGRPALRPVRTAARAVPAWRTWHGTVCCREQSVSGVP